MDVTDLEERIDRLVAELTTDEKAALTGGRDMWHLPAVEHLGIGRLTMSDGPSGVRGERMGLRRSLSFPCGTAVGSTWDVDLVRRYGGALADEARSKGVHLLLGPTVCIPRTPLAGRTFESFAEDPFLTAELTVAYVDGVQGRGVGCCVKHFACNDQEHERMTISAEVDERTLREIHLPAFEAAVRRAGVWAVMSAYNKVNGTWCGEHPWLLSEVLKGEWGFDGLVVSDWFGTHSTVAAATAGLDVEMPGPPAHLGAALGDAVTAGEVPSEVLDEQVRRILRVAGRAGVLDGAAHPGEAEDDDPERRALARRLAVAGTVLLRNDDLLPLDPAVRSVAVIGPNADLVETGGGGSAQVTPHRHLSFVDELRQRLPDATVTHEPGCRLGEGPPPVDPRLIAPGLRLETFASPDRTGDVVDVGTLATGYLVSIGRPVPGLRLADASFRASGTFRPHVSGTWTLGVANAGSARLLLDGRPVVDNGGPADGAFFFGMGHGEATAEVALEAGRAYELEVELTPEEGVPLVGLRLAAAPPAVADPMGRAVAAAAAADVAVVVVGANGRLETEGSDRASLALPGDQDELVRAVAAANPRTVVVVNAGAPVTMPWADDVAAVAMLWYPGEEGAPALADVVTGRAEPTGRLPLTFPVRLEDTPTHGDFYPGADGRVVYGERTLVGYRHYDAHDVEPAFCFGHGLGYTTFAYGEPTADVGEGSVVVTVPVTNTGDRRGREVVQVYVGAADVPEPRAPRSLGAFAPVTLDPGATAPVRLEVPERAWSHWDEDAGGWRVAGGPLAFHVGSSSRALHRTVVVDLAS